MTIEEVRKIKVISVEYCEHYNAQKICFECNYFNRLEIITISMDNKKFIIIEENRVNKFYIIIPFEINTSLKINDLVTYNTILL